MAAEDIFELLDSYWFEHEIFTKFPISCPGKTDPVLELVEEVQGSKFSSLPSHLHGRSLSDHDLMMSCKSGTGTFSSDDHSLTPNKLQTILSGTEVNEFASESINQQEAVKGMAEMIRRNNNNKKMKMMKKKKSSKSLSDLEFEELKGFMDLGFVFPEKVDQDSSLVSIIPGLQRLLKGNGEGLVDHQEAVLVSRPYLSEAWDVLDQRKVENSLMNLRVPSLGNEVNIKDHLRFWAQTVASTVR